MEANTLKPTAHIQAALYARVSTEEQREGQTIESQVRELQKFAQEKGYSIVKEYVDDGWSGGLLNRPALDALRDDAGAGCFQAVLLYDVDRLAREVAHLGIVKRDLEKKGVRLIFRKLPNGNSPTDHLLVNMLGAFAEFERELIADRTRRGKRYKAETRKLIVGNIPPYGFRYVKKDKEANTEGYYQVSEEEAAAVKKMFDLVDRRHYSARRVVKWLTENMVPPRKGAKRWGRSSVLRVLHRTEYIGLAYYNKYECVEPRQPRTLQKYRRHKKSGLRLRPQSEWIPIPVPECKLIPEDQFQRVQAILSQNKVFSKRNTRYEYLLGKLLYCACGALFYGCPMHGRPFYRCSNKERQSPLPKTCQTGIISARLVDVRVWEALKVAVQNSRMIAAHQPWDHWTRRQEVEKSEVESLRESIQKIDTEESRVFDAYKVGAITLERYQEEARGFNERRAAFQGRLQQLLEGQKPSFSPADLKTRLSRFCAVIRRGIRNVEQDFEARQRIIRLLVSKAVLNAQTREVALEVNIPLTEGNPGQLDIVPTSSYDCGHNMTLPLTLIVKV